MSGERQSPSCSSPASLRPSYITSVCAFVCRGKNFHLQKQPSWETQRHLAVARQMQEKLESLSHEMIRMQEDDRRRISREIHDEMGQLFSMLTVNFELIRKYAAKDPGQVAARVEAARQLAGQVSDRVRSFL